MPTFPNMEKRYYMDDRWIKYGARLASKVYGKYRIASVVLDKRGKLLSTGTNSYTRSHPTQARHAAKSGNPSKQFLHAEIAALINCRGVAYKIVTVRIKRDGTFGLAKPCPVCELAIKEAGIRIVEYTT